jgi:hypothetical protein
VKYGGFRVLNDVETRKDGFRERFFLKRVNPNAGLGYMPVLPIFPIVTKRK